MRDTFASFRRASSGAAFFLFSLPERPETIRPIS
jgi:hypothetical protein